MKRGGPKFCGGGRWRRGAAFSLLEVLVALAIFAMAFVVLLSAYVNILGSYNGIARSREADEDVKFSRAALLAEPDILKAQAGDEFDSTNGRHVKWTATIDPDTTMPDLFTVNFECDVTESGAPEPEKIMQTFEALRPTWSTDPTARAKLMQDVKDRISDLQGKQPNGFVPATPAPAGGGGGGGRGGRGAAGGGRGGRGGGAGGGGGGRGGRNGGGGNGFGGGNGNGGNGFGGPGGFGGQGGQGGQGGRRGGQGNGGQGNGGQGNGGGGGGRRRTGGAAGGGG
jgi:hypothetical protein